MNTLKEVSEVWADNADTHRRIAEYFYAKADGVPILKELRTFIEQNTYGHGEFCMYWNWKLLVDEMPPDFRFIEIGVHKGQILCLMAILAEMAGKYHRHCIFGLSPMNGAEIGNDGNFYDAVHHLHQLFNAPADYEIIEGLSTDSLVLEKVKHLGAFDILYVDGGHSFETCTFDLVNYAPLVKSGGYLVIDDACSNMNLPNGYFRGIQSVTDATLQWEPAHPEFEFLFSVSHNKLYRKH